MGNVAPKGSLMRKTASTEIFSNVFPKFAPGELPRGHGERLLVVDDQEGVLQCARAVLTKFGYRVMTAGSGAEALLLYARHKQKIALVIADIVMPNMNGPTVIWLLRLINPKVRVIAMSGYAPISPAVEALHADEEHFLGKPFTTQELLCMIRDTLAEPDRLATSPGARPAAQAC